MKFNNELVFEKALITKLFDKGWDNNVLKNKTEQDLIDNWAEILFKNNRSIDRLNDFPLTSGEMQQILSQVNQLRTPLKLNGFINGKTVTIKRDNQDDKLHFGKEVSLNIYDRQEIAGGTSCYQIAEQPIFSKKSSLLNDRRGDFMLLINGMPVIHVELKKSGIPISQACNQIEKYSHEGVFTGLFSLVQVFVAMTPEETLYFANPGIDGQFNKNFYFHWADVNNEPINDWERIASNLLSIPMAHQLIGFYTVADDTDGILKVLRSYQYYAASKISDRVAKTKWQDKDIFGGYIWHTTGSGKTMTSFKSAQLIANSKDADKVVFLMDRIELGTQSLQEYRNFADDKETVQATENTSVLVNKLKSDNSNEVLIVTSIQKMSNIKEESAINTNDIAKINKKRLVFIIDECHRSTFGTMLRTIKTTFPRAIFFGFTGTPIFEENKKKMNDTSDVFGNELHRYSIADGIRDGNVLGFDPYKVQTYKEKDLRKVIALEKAKAETEIDAFKNQQKAEIYNYYMKKVPMAGYINEEGKYIFGIEDLIPKNQYLTEEHTNKVVEDIAENWTTLSNNNKFHAIFATSSIPEAINYYKLIKKAMPQLKVTALFDSTIDNSNGAIIKEDAIVEILKDYNATFNQNFTIPTFDKFKVDVSYRLAHKKQYLGIEKHPEMQLNLLIVVNQMLTGFDSKWINTLYLDKFMEYESIIQAFSRTNRLFGPDKPFGTIRYYRYPNTMERNIEEAFKLYSGDRPFGLFVEKLEKNLNTINKFYDDIKDLFTSFGIDNFEKLPEDVEAKQKFALQFKELNGFLEAAKIQGFDWKILEYTFKHTNKPTTNVVMHFDEKIYLVLALRYKELFSTGGDGTLPEQPYDIEGYLTEINTGAIDVDYMNSRFKKYLRELNNGKESTKALNELHKTFATLSQEEQKFAMLFLHDVQTGEIAVQENKSFRDYITDYQTTAKSDQIHRFSEMIGVDEQELRKFINLHLSESNMNEYGRFEKLKNTVNIDIAKKYFDNKEQKSIPIPMIRVKIDQILRKFIILGGFEI
ncbi:MAG: HsdR family type I site-specific deoxyribonuclease [Bacteroidales bacterium]